MNKETLTRLCEGYIRLEKRNVMIDTELGKHGIEFYDYCNPLTGAVEKVLDDVYEELVSHLLDLAHSDRTRFNGVIVRDLETLLDAVLGGEKVG